MARFYSRADLVAAVVGSEYPVGAGASCSAPFRGLEVNDALYTDGIPCGAIGDDETLFGEPNCVRVSVFPMAIASAPGFSTAFPGAFTKAAIFPGSSGALGVPLEVFSPTNLFSAAAVRPYLGALIAQGYADGAAWAAAQNV